MKKRVISFLLSITMLVAAVPVTTIGSAAADSLTTITASDMFKMNSDGKLILAPNIVASPNENLTILDAAAILVAVLRPTAKVENKNAIGLTDKTKGIYERAVGMGTFSSTAKTNVNAKLSLKGAYTVIDKTFKLTEEQKGLVNLVAPEVLFGGITVEEFIDGVDVMTGTILNGKGTYKIDKFDTKNVTITKPGITLEGTTIEGKLTIADGVGDGDVTIKDVTVKGNIVARGCGKNTFKMLGSSSTKELIAANMNHAFRVFAESAEAIMDMIIASGHNGVTVDAACGNITSYTTAPVLVTKDAKNVMAAVKDSDITIGSAARVGVLSSAASATGATLTVQGAVDALNAAAPDTGVKALNGAKLGLVTTETTATGTTVSAAKGSVIKDLKANAANTAVTGSGDVISATINGNNVSIGTGSTKVIVAAGVKDTTVGNNPVNGGTNIVSPVAPTAPDDLPTGEITTQGDGTTAPAVTTAAVTTAAETQIPVAPPALVSEVLLFLEAPRAGETPQQLADTATQYGSNVTWKGADGTVPDKFVEGTVYTATITLTAKSIYSFDGMAASRFSVNGIPAIGSENGVSGAITFNFTFPPAKEIAINTELWIEPPIPGKGWFKTYSNADDGSYVYLYEISDSSGHVLTENEIYKTSTAYTVVFKLFANEQSSFNGIEATDFTVNGNTVTKPGKATDGEMIIEYTFSKTAAQNAPIEKVEAEDLRVNLPVAGKLAICLPYPHAAYECRITYRDASGVLIASPATFDTGTVYTATMSLKARPGYTFLGVKANEFTVNNITVIDTAEGTADGLTFSYEFPMTADTIVDETITGENLNIDVPVAGRRVNNDLALPFGYDINSFVWRDDNNVRISSPAVFTISTPYTATIVLEADYGFQFATDSFSINNDPVTAVLSDENRVATITKTFTTGADEVLSKVTETNLLIGELIVDKMVLDYSNSQVYAETVLLDKNGCVASNKPTNTETLYTVKVKLTAMPGFTLKGMTASDFTVNGKTITDTAIGTDKEMVISYTDRAKANSVIPVAERNFNVYTPIAGECSMPQVVVESEYTYSYGFPKKGTEEYFKANSSYELALTAIADEGYTFEGINPQDFRINHNLIPTTAKIENGKVMLTYTFTTGEIITEKVTDTNLTIDYPVAGDMKDAFTDNYEFDSLIMWHDESGAPVDVNTPFVQGKTYTADVTLAAYPAHTFLGMKSTDFTVNGHGVTISEGPTTDGGSIAIKYTFPPTQAVITVLEKLQDTNIRTDDIFLDGNISEATFSNQYLDITNLTWTKNDVPLTVTSETKFEKDTYEATFTVSINPLSEDYYTLEGLTEADFTVDGYNGNIRLMSTTEDSVTFACTFVIYDLMPIKGDTAIEILAPVAGRTLDTSSVFLGYYCTDAVTWETADGTPATGKAEAGTAYTATVILTADPGYTFKGADDSNFVVNGKAATATIAPDGTTVTLTYEFPATAPVL